MSLDFKLHDPSTALYLRPLYTDLHYTFFVKTDMAISNLNQQWLYSDTDTCIFYCVYLNVHSICQKCQNYNQ